MLRRNISNAGIVALESRRGAPDRAPRRGAWNFFIGIATNSVVRPWAPESMENKQR